MYVFFDLSFPESFENCTAVDTNGDKFSVKWNVRFRTQLPSNVIALKRRVDVAIGRPGILAISRLVSGSVLIER